MKPCVRNKRYIAWMASGILDAERAETLREHLKSCAGCRGYWRNMSELSQRLANAGPSNGVEPTESFHRRVIQEITARKSRTFFFDWLGAMRWLSPERRLATVVVGVAFGIAVLLLIQIFSHERDDARSRRRIAANQQPVKTSPQAVPATFGLYRRAADRSLENLEILLSQQAARISSANETFTISDLLTSSSEN